MHILSFLAGSFPSNAESGVIRFEYRLLCSGALYNGATITTDWSKGDAARPILLSPFSLFVCSHPFDDYPQELALRFQCPLVTETSKSQTSYHYPDDEIAHDLAALLSLFLRRLITVAAKVRETRDRSHPRELEVFLDYPVDFINTLTPSYWARKPASVSFGAQGIIDLVDYNPRPLPVDPHLLEHLLRGLPGCAHPKALVRSARLYSLALQQIERDVDIAYQLLVSSIEATANEVFSNYQPTPDQILDAKRTVFDLAIQSGLSPDTAQALALEACKGMSWSSRKFVKFIIENARPSTWPPDDLFRPMEHFIPDSTQFESALRTIYANRGSATHGGPPYPDSVQIGVGPTIPSRALQDVDFTTGSIPVPPVVWFERVVNSALVQFVRSFVDGDSSTTSPGSG
jgi:hypothetical protein